MTRPSTIERALEIARSGEVNKLPELYKLLKREGYTNFGQHMMGRSFKRQIIEALKQAGRTSPPTNGIAGTSGSLGDVRETAGDLRRDSTTAEPPTSADTVNTS